ncbi:hypothetical protein GKZ89_08255 [Bacillus mangrovi]|uniref:DUF5673 domain-containing protein n=1 Tax=Metabacillus mangrovi TaxID=1491830 RepID=A0A7X2S4T1_9BACI|nr:hypothetical protein [Metabacillus mangrovi]MTH53407.1 hypothetical protein [Metabacillus mangrovi]
MLETLILLAFAGGSYYLLQHRKNIMKAADLSRKAIYPQTKEEFSSTLVPSEWKEMEPISKETRSYQLVKWGTPGLLLVFAGASAVILVSDAEYNVLLLLNVFAGLFNLIKHQGNLFILEKGCIIDGKLYSFHQIKDFEAERITLSHSLYGLNSRLNKAYKLTFRYRNQWHYSRYVVIEDEKHLKKITDLLEERGVSGTIRASAPAVNKFTDR